MFQKKISEGSSSGAPRAPRSGSSSSSRGYSSKPRVGGSSSFGTRPRTSGGYAGSSPRSTSGSSSYAARSASAGSSYSSAPRTSSSSSSSFGTRPRTSSSSSFSGGSSSGGYRGGSSSYSSGSRSGSSSSFGTRPRTSGGSSYRGGSSSRGGFGGGRSGGGNRGGGRRGFKEAKFDTSMFISKAVITEEVVHFIPEHMFTDFNIAESLKKTIVAKGYSAPTPIQDRVIPHIINGQDVVGIANTGTGKTAAFLIPLINKVILNPKEQVLIMVPTRELAIQIEEELHGLVKGMKIYSVCCVGGANIRPQMQALRYHNNFVIGTPGRLKDLLERKYINLANFKSVVLDEADRMLDMGFIGDMKYMMALMPKDRHTLFFSATMSREIEVLIKDFLNEPVSISVKTQDTSKNVDQDVIRVKAGDVRIELLHDLLIKPECTKVLIFGRTKHGVEKLSNELIRKGIKADSIHGDKNHARRQRALKAFKEHQLQVLVATDVAARGLDISGVSHVINYELPATYDDYIHRIGRTGRGGKHGKALTFVNA